MILKVAMFGQVSTVPNRKRKGPLFFIYCPGKLRVGNFLRTLHDAVLALRAELPLRREAER